MDHRRELEDHRKLLHLPQHMTAKQQHRVIFHKSDMVFYEDTIMKRNSFSKQRLGILEAILPTVSYKNDMRYEEYDSSVIKLLQELIITRDLPALENGTQSLKTTTLCCK